MEALFKRRSVVKGLLTRLRKFATTLSEDTCQDEVVERLRRAKDLLQKFTDIEDEIFTTNPLETSEVEEFEEQYYQVVATLNKWLRLKTLSSTNQFNDSLINTSHVSNNDFKLPRVNIASFSGDYREWQGFFDLFNKMVHENKGLSAAQKFQYLKGLLKGEANNLVKHLTATEANYIEAFHKLCKRYDRKSLTANSFIKLFMEQPAIRNVNSSSIRNLLDTSDEATRGLKALGEETESKDPWLLYILFNKLDDESKQLWMRHIVDQDFPTLESFYDFLANRADELEGINCSNKSQPTRSNSVVKGFHLKPEVKVTCPVCQTNDHQLFECSKFKAMDVTARREMIKTEGRCFNCLNNNHSVYNCRSFKKCRLCFKKHHSLLHISDTSNDKSFTDKTSATSSLHQPESEKTSPQSKSLPSTSSADNTTSSSYNIEAP